MQKLYYMHDNKTSKEKSENYNVIKKLMSFSGVNYTFQQFKKEYGHHKQINLTINPETQKEYDEIIAMMPYRIEINPK